MEFHVCLGLSLLTTTRRSSNGLEKRSWVTNKLHDGKVRIQFITTTTTNMPVVSGDQIQNCFQSVETGSYWTGVYYELMSNSTAVLVVVIEDITSSLFLLLSIWVVPCMIHDASLHFYPFYACNASSLSVVTLAIIQNHTDTRLSRGKLDKAIFFSKVNNWSKVCSRSCYSGVAVIHQSPGVHCRGEDCHKQGKGH